MNGPFDDLDRLCIDTLRTLSIDAVEKANSGHPGLPLGAAPMAWVLWSRHLRHDPADPKWPDRDRFVLSAGHGSMLLYSLLYLSGYGLTLDDLKSFRQWGSRTPGHPEVHATPGVEATTGPLGQGLTNAVGMAIAERFLAHRYNRPGKEIVGHRTFVIASDGDMMEGVSGEASSLAGHLGLSRLLVLYDANHVSLDGPTSLAFTEDVGQRYEAYGWRVLRVEDGDHDLEGIDRAIAAGMAETDRPSLVIVRTTIGFGAPHKQGTSEAHGSPLGPDEVRATKQNLGWDPDRAFFVPEEAQRRFDELRREGQERHAAWRRAFDEWKAKNPDPAKEWELALARQLPAGWDADLPSWKPGESVATRSAGGKVLNALVRKIPWILGGDADLSTSTKTGVAEAPDFDGRTGAGRNIHFGVREHAMAGIANGIAYHGGVHPYVATFFAFSDYMRPALRLAALSQLPVSWVWTHDSIGLGEDGPTHQPIEQLMSIRAIPNVWLVRPADANETREAWKLAIQRTGGPTGLVLTRQNVPVLDRSAGGGGAEGVERGAYVLAEADPAPARAIVLATGSEVAVALEGREILRKEGIGVRVVSMPCWEAFEAQTQAYRDSVLPPSIDARVSVEAGATLGWSRWIGSRGVAIGIDRFGSSAPGEVNMERLGFTGERVASAVRGLLGASSPAGGQRSAPANERGER